MGEEEVSTVSFRALFNLGIVKVGGAGVQQLRKQIQVEVYNGPMGIREASKISNCTKVHEEIGEAEP